MLVLDLRLRWATEEITRQAWFMEGYSGNGSVEDDIIYSERLCLSLSVAGSRIFQTIWQKLAQTWYTLSVYCATCRKFSVPKIWLDPKEQVVTRCGPRAIEVVSCGRSKCNFNSSTLRKTQFNKLSATENLNRAYFYKQKPKRNSFCFRRGWCRHQKNYHAKALLEICS